MTHGHSETIDWTAFRYVAGEMPAGEAVSFEKLLEHDLAACEAVARAVELAQAVAMAEEQAVESRPAITIVQGGHRRPRWVRYATMLAAAAAACLAVTALWHASADLQRPMPVMENNPAPGAVIADVVRVEALALAWSETGKELDVLSDEPWPGDSSEISEDVVVDVEPGVGGELEPAPSWMLAAVSEMPLRLPPDLLFEGPDKEK